MELVYLIVGIVVGGLLGWLAAQYLRSGKGSDHQSADLNARLDILKQNLEEKSREKEEIGRKLEEERSESENLLQRIATYESEQRHLEQRLSEKQTEMEEGQKKLAIEFENLANRILDEKTKKFTETNKSNLGDILNPLKERIEKFEKKVEESNRDSHSWNKLLQDQISNLSKDAENLTQALKGDSKTQGNWGELQLEVILEKAGLQKGVHYDKELNLKSEDGSNQRPDFVINLPDEKCLILDSKVSLTAYTRYLEAEDESQKAGFLKQHLDSINGHIKSLSEKSYQSLYNINQPDYILMFVANEPALVLALQQDADLYTKALEKNIVLSSSTFLLATLRMISFIWKQDSQNKNAVEIAKKAGLLYDKFVNFSSDLIGIGKKLDDSKEAYSKAMNKLIEGRGNLISKAEELKVLGAKTSKDQEQALIDRADPK